MFPWVPDVRLCVKQLCSPYWLWSRWQILEKVAGKSSLQGTQEKERGEQEKATTPRNFQPIAASPTPNSHAHSHSGRRAPVMWRPLPLVVLFWAWTAWGFSSPLLPDALLAARPRSRGPRHASASYAGRKSTSPFTMMAVELKVNDRVCVIGSTGGCGQLITARLVDEGRYQVKAVGRSEAKLREVLGGESPKLEFAEADSRDIDSLYGPLSDVDCVIIATGTSAFPSPRWRGGNTPDAVDRKGVQNILKAITSKPRKRTVKKVVFLSSVGVLRTKQLPYSILNAFGVLDAKRDSEDLLRQMAATEGFDILIVRPGRLVGGPWTNTDVSALLKVEEGARKRVVVEQGDSLVGDAARVSVAELVVRALGRPEAMGRALCVVNEEGPPFSEGQWTALFEGLA